MLRYIVAVCVLFCMIDVSWAESWEDALQIDIVTREEWGADEVWRRSSSFGIASTPTPLGLRGQLMIDYLSTHFSSDLEVDEIRYDEGGEELWRPLEYKADKKGIVIHHTASSQERIDEQGGIIPHIQQMYKFHTFTRAWGDIGYNFLIDQEGVIYEGRAGGTNVIGAHTRRNNNGTVGISLIGNFQEDYPSDAMMDALTDLSVSLSSYYGIDPNDDIIIHQETSIDPYLAPVHSSSILGHRDAGATSCPGDHVYMLLPRLRYDVANALISRALSVEVDAIHTDGAVHWLEGDSNDDQQLLLMSDDTALMGSVSCEWAQLGDESLSVPLRIVGCAMDGDDLSLSVRVVGGFVPGPYPVVVDDGSRQEVRYVRTVRDTALTKLLEQRRESFIHQLPRSPQPFPKITDYLTMDEARQRAESDIRVLLHDVSVGTTAQTISCEHRCIVTVEDASDNRTVLGDDAIQYTTTGSFFVLEFEGVLSMTIDGQDVHGSSLAVYDAGRGWVSLDSYERTSYAGVPWNRFVGTIHITQDDFKNIMTATWNHEYVYINELTFRDYLLGLAEAAVTDPLEKQKVLALLTKTYAMFYLSDNEHPSMDEVGYNVTYDAIDDPRAFQKYVGVGWLDVHPVWESVVNEMWDVWVAYDDYIPILPYFNCSAGFTRGAQERRGWTDTPWLESVVDWIPSACTEFAGHGVGLSGQGATYMAQRDIRYDDILKYYYSGIVIDNR